jgi:RNA polymerase sigma factor (sigma-70 family)
MPGLLPDTPRTLLAGLRDADGTPMWQMSWKRFLELYHEPISIIVRGCYRHHTGGAEPSSGFIEDATANVVTDFFAKGHRRYDPSKGRLRTYLRMLVNARVVDLLRKERPLQFRDDTILESLPPEEVVEDDAYRRSILVTLVEELREQIPLRQFEIFERVKLKGLSPDAVAAELGVKRGVVDNSVYKAMIKLREIAAGREYQEEYYA